MNDDDLIESFVIYDKSGAPIYVISPLDEPLTNKQMKKLMKLFKGKENSESLWIIKELDE